MDIPCLSITAQFVWLNKSLCGTCELGAAFFGCSTEGILPGVQTPVFVTL